MNAVTRKQRWRAENPDAYRAELMTRSAVLTGRLVPPKKCSQCGKKRKTHFHHPDYTKPLEVVALCRKCHADYHKREGSYEKEGKQKDGIRKV